MKALDRSDAVNLARGLRMGDARNVTERGAKCLAEAVLAMDEALKRLYSIEAVAQKFRDAFTYDPGHSDLDNEQPIHVSVTLGDWRKLNFALRPNIQTARGKQRMKRKRLTAKQSTAFGRIDRALAARVREQPERLLLREARPYLAGEGVGRVAEIAQLLRSIDVLLAQPAEASQSASGTSYGRLEITIDDAAHTRETYYDIPGYDDLPAGKYELRRVDGTARGVER